MCWFIDVGFDLIEKTRGESSILEKLDHSQYSYYNEASFYQLSEGGCLCDYFGSNSKSREKLATFLYDLLETEGVKRMVLVKYWSERKNFSSKVDLPKTQLKHFLTKDNLVEDTVYTILDIDKFSY